MFLENSIFSCENVLGANMSICQKITNFQNLYTVYVPAFSREPLGRFGRNLVCEPGPTMGQRGLTFVKIDVRLAASVTSITSPLTIDKGKFIEQYFFEKWKIINAQKLVLVLIFGKWKIINAQKIVLVLKNANLQKKLIFAVPNFCPI